MTDVVTLQARLDQLRASRSTGVLSLALTTDGVTQQTTFKNDADMASAIAALESEIAAATGSRVRTITVRNSGGW